MIRPILRYGADVLHEPARPVDEITGDVDLPVETLRRHACLADIIPVVLDGNGVPSESKMVRVTPPMATRPMAAVDGQVVRLYRAFFQRQPDEAGYRYWRRALLTGGSLQAIADSFAASPELVARYGQLDDVSFVDQVYGNVLGREADPEGRAFWQGQLYAGMSRGQMMTEFAGAAAPADGGVSDFEVPLSGLASGEYILQIDATGEGGDAQELVAIRVTG